MTIRLNKVTRDLNVGIATVVEFLQKKGHTVEANPNTKISEEQSLGRRSPSLREGLRSPWEGRAQHAGRDRREVLHRVRALRGRLRGREP